MTNPSLEKNLETLFTNAVNNQLNNQLDLAQEGYLTCIESEYKIFDCLNNLGLLYTEIQDFQKAEYVYLQMIKMKNDCKDAYLNLGSIYSQLGHTDSAINLFIEALERNPQFIEIYNNLGVLYKAQNKYEEALSTYVSGLLIASESESLQHNLSNIIHGNTLPLKFMKLDSIEVLLSRCLSFPNNEYQGFSIAVLGYLFDKYELDGRVFDNEGGRLLLKNTLFHTILRKTIVTNFDLEHFLIKVRKEILHEIVNKGYTKKELDPLKTFMPSLAIQCFWTEYIYSIDEEESVLLEKLDAITAEAIKRKDKNSLFYIALYGCYKPLHETRFLNNKFIRQEKSKDAVFKELLRIQVEEPLMEKELKESVVVLNPLDDVVSKKVAQQYEENPYPRWSSVRKSKSESLENTIRGQLPLIKDLNCHHGIENKIEVLIAGSGTGKHPIEVSQQISNTNVLGVDLSRSSIAYAQRKTIELNLKNLKFIQANILDLKQMQKQFDLIESVGVLHHMDDPMKGWKVLTDILKPNGYMKIGLYSELARKSVVDTISFIEEKGYEAKLDDIRRCRDDIYHLDPTHSMWNLANYIDFYSVSGTRDLIFNIQEHRFTIPKIKAAVQTLGLKFLGFSFRDKNIVHKYLEMFPEDLQAQDLQNWHQFEEKYPDTFIEMYQFWLQK